MSDIAVEKALLAASNFSESAICRRWQGIGELPRKLQGGFPYTGVNIPALLGQIPDGTPAIFGTDSQWKTKSLERIPKSKGISYIFIKSFKKKDKDAKDLKAEDEDLEVTEQGRVLVPYGHSTLYSQGQMLGFENGITNPILEAIKRDKMDKDALVATGKRAIESAKTYMQKWLESKNANLISEGEMSFIVHLAADLVVGYNGGSMALAGELMPMYPENALEAVHRLKVRQIMRPWGIACDILKQLSPVFDAQVKAGELAGKEAQELFQKKRLEKLQNTQVASEPMCPPAIQIPSAPNLIVGLGNSNW